MAGFQRNQWEGNDEIKAIDDSKPSEDFTEREKVMIMQWYAGQTISIIEQEAWYAVNSLLNAGDTCARKEWL